MAQPGTFEKCKKQIEGAINRQTKKGETFCAMDLPYYLDEDKKLTDAYLQELKARGYTVEISTPSEWAEVCGKIKW
ncbi:hypothetical protein [Acinetobacter sp. V2]|uniref:hypothetical protein n=1 Tax=Acinetobacter sp. V2 TaxID=1051623 RepID=UPI00061FA7E6|nr:hypothetical protein [Acinetobacter sp. V2]KKC45300.1 hypothetical protein UC75_07400 [Acinetobacter sp. V2]